MSAVDRIAEAFLLQATGCERLGSPATAALLRQLTEDLRKAGPVLAIVEDFEDDPVEAALSLRLVGGLRYLALAGERTPERRLDKHVAFLREFVRRPVQTNEVGRSLPLLGGFLVAAARFALPLRLLEIGSSAGLNLLWDRYHHAFGDATWGAAESPVRLEAQWKGELPPLSAPVEIAERRGCDTAPIDLYTEEGCRRAECYIWPDQTARFARFRAAVEVAREERVRVETADAGDWLETRLETPTPGALTVVFHSIVRQYLSPGSRAAVEAALDAAGKCATPNAPLAHLAMEPETPEARPDLRLTLWPGGETRRLAWCHPHGAKVEWLH